MSPNELRWLDDLADRLFNQLNIDVEFTKHFFDRANDERSDYRDRQGRQHEQGITAEELAKVFVAAYKQASDQNSKFVKVTDIPTNAEATIRDHFTKLNIPFVMKKAGGQKVLTPKTVMRKDNFANPPGTKSVPVNSKDVALDEDIITEGLAHPVICVDVQPEYSGMNDGDESAVFPEIINFVNKQTGPVLMFVNAEDQGLTGDSVASIKQYWNDTICPEEERYTYDEESDEQIENTNCPTINWSRFTIADKGYGYLRSWMDHGIEPSTIIATIREMYAQKVSDTRELRFPPFNRRTTTQSLIMGAIEEMEDDPMTVGWTSVAQLKRFNGAYLVGGGRDECLREVELLMNAFNIKYKRIDSLVY
jgi:hypothetical protein